MRRFRIAALLSTFVLGTTLAGCKSGGGPSAMPELAPRADLIPVGQKAPDFEASDQTGHPVRLSKLLKKGEVVLIFYPGDFTPGCTKQLCAVRDDWSQFQKRGATVVGINPADAAKHARFATQYGFPFPLIADAGSRITAAYGARGPSATQRTVYVIRKDGTVALAERGMVAHEEIFAALKG
jgi:thioredoxin-dependent peroxiredoxin